MNADDIERAVEQAYKYAVATDFTDSSADERTLTTTFSAADTHAALLRSIETGEYPKVRYCGEHKAPAYAGARMCDQAIGEASETERHTGKWPSDLAACDLTDSVAVPLALFREAAGDAES